MWNILNVPCAMDHMLASKVPCINALLSSNFTCKKVTTSLALPRLYSKQSLQLAGKKNLSSFLSAL